MKDKMYLGVTIIVCILFIILPFAGAMGNNVQKEYGERGIDVEATVTDVTRLRRNKYITVEYVAQDGSVISASATMNRASVQEGDVFIGKVLPEKPNEVYDMPSNTLVIVTNVLMYGLSLLGWIILICMCVVWIRNRKFKKKGIYTQARVVDYKMDGNYYIEILAFYTREGVYFQADSPLQEEPPQMGRTYTIRYLPSDPNKIQIVY